MRRTLALLGLTALGLAAWALPATAAPESVIVVLRDSVEDPGAVARQHTVAAGTAPVHVYRSALRGYAAVLPGPAQARIAADPRVLFISPDRPVRVSAQSLPTGVNRIDAELSATARINGSDDRVDVDVAILDTGIDTAHADLNVAGGKNCSTGTSYRDGNGHGTHVAGTVGAKDNLTGVVGVAPGARLWSVRVLNNAGSGSWSSIICGIDWVTANASVIEVANMSLGGAGTDDGNCGNSNNDALHRAVCRSVGAGVTYAVAAGNDARNAAGVVPAAYDEVITVSALADFNGVAGGGAAPTCRSDVDDTFADFSNFGADVDIAAPGVCIASTWKGGGYRTISGTSMASPHVAGAAALYRATAPTASPATVRQALIDGREPGPITGDPDTFKEGVLSARLL
jgi:subtilisin family serine protease